LMQTVTCSTTLRQAQGDSRASMNIEQKVQECDATMMHEEQMLEP
jgi:hypothetical protein